MIVVRVELWSALTGRRTELARMVIDNVGGDANVGDYQVRTMRGRNEAALHAHMLAVLTDRAAPQRKGKVLGHARLKEHVWNLVAKALSNTGYGKVKE
jgi:hypothetical protein